MGTAFVINTELVTEQCCNCGITFAVPLPFQEARKRDHELLYCPHGHGQHYPAESDIEKLRRQRNELSDKAARLERCCTEAQNEANELERKIPFIRAGYRGQLARIKNKERAKGGQG